MTMLTTIDNPYDPFTQYDAWLSYDEQAGYYTNEYLARIANTSPAMTDSEVGDAIDSAMDMIIRNDPFGLYIKADSATFKVNKGAANF